MKKCYGEEGRCSMFSRGHDKVRRTRTTGHGHVFKRIGWKNICKLWLGERTPEQLKGEESQ